MSQVFKNKAIVSPSYDGDANGVNWLGLNESPDTGQSVPLDIPHTFGSDTLNSIEPTVLNSDEITTFSSNIYNDFDLAVTTIGTSSGNPKVVTNGTSDYLSTKTYIISFDVVLNSGICVLEEIRLGSNYAIYSMPITTGTYEIEYTPIGDNPIIVMGFDGTSLFDISVTNWTVKEITNPNSYLTILPRADDLHKILGNSVDGGSSTDEVVNGTFNENVLGWDLYGSPALSWENGKAKIMASTVDEGISQSGILIATRQYSISVDITNSRSTVMNFNITLGSLVQGSFFEDIFLNPGETRTVSVNLKCADIVTPLFIIRTAGGGISSGDTWYIDNVSLKEILPISTTYNQDATFTNAFTTDVAVTSADRVLLDANPNLAFELLKGSTTTGLSFGTSNIKHMYLGNEGVNGGAYCQDVVQNLGIEEYTGGIIRGSANFISTPITNGYNLVVTSNDRLLFEGRGTLGKSILRNSA